MTTKGGVGMKKEQKSDNLKPIKNPTVEQEKKRQIDVSSLLEHFNKLNEEIKHTIKEKN